MKTFLLLSCLFLSISTFAIDPEPPLPFARSFKATPNPIPVSVGETLGITTISWDAVNVTGVDVRVGSYNGALFASGGKIGQSTTGKWVGNGTKFFLIGKPTGEVLSEITVNLQSPATSTGTISASPTSCSIPQGQQTCSTTISWSTTNVVNAIVKIQGFSFASGLSGSQVAPWIQATPAVFELWGDGTKLASVTVIGVPTNPTPTPVPTFSRMILAPYNVVDPIGMFLVDHVGKPLDKFYLQARYQKPVPTDTYSSPVQYSQNYNAVGNTGLGPWSNVYQRGPLGGSQAQSTYQLKGTEIGILMRSFDSPHPSLLPVCQPNCAGYQKHTVYEHRWSTPPLVFSAQNNSRFLEIESDFQVLQFEKWSTIDGGAPKGLIAGQFAIVLFLEDPSGKQIQYVIFVYDSSPATNDGSEGLHLEVIGAGNNGYFVSTSMKKARPMTYTTVDPSNSHEFSHFTWTGYRNFKVRLTPQNLTNAIRDLNNLGGSLSTNIWNYKIRQIGINQEIYSENNGDAWVMGSSTRNLKVQEKGP